MIEKPPQRSSSENYEVILSFSDHWIVLVKPIARYMANMAIAIALWSAGKIFGQISDILNLFLQITSYGLVLVAHHLLFVRLLNWEISNWVITTKLVIDFEDSIYFKNDVTFINIAQIQEIEKKKHGFFSNLFDYGDVYINVPATPYPTICQNIPHPDQFINLVEAIRNNRVEQEMSVQMLRNIYGRKFRSIVHFSEESQKK